MHTRSGAVAAAQRDIQAPGALAGHALYLDIDGTVLDIAPRPDAVEVPPWLIPLLGRLRLRLGGAVAFVTGRTIEEVDRLFDPLRLPAVGVHGGELRVSAEVMRFEEALSQRLQRCEPYLREHLAPLPGVMLENKHGAIALHYRAAPESGREVLRVAQHALVSLGAEFDLMVGKCVVELRPRWCTKAEGLRRLMEHPPFQGRTPIFAGDDTADEDAFHVVNALGGISVRVGSGTGAAHTGSGPTAARCTLADPDALRAWLADLGRDE
jgi:trehalose 6-phosphate phosphatase